MEVSLHLPGGCFALQIEGLSPPTCLWPGLTALPKTLGLSSLSSALWLQSSGHSLNRRLMPTGTRLHCRPPEMWRPTLGLPHQRRASEPIGIFNLLPSETSLKILKLKLSNDCCANQCLVMQMFIGFPLTNSTWVLVQAVAQVLGFTPAYTIP